MLLLSFPSFFCGGYHPPYTLQFHPFICCYQNSSPKWFLYKHYISHLYPVMFFSIQPFFFVRKIRDVYFCRWDSYCGGYVSRGKTVESGRWGVFLRNIPFCNKDLCNQKRNRPCHWTNDQDYWIKLVKHQNIYSNSHRLISEELVEKREMASNLVV